MAVKKARSTPRKNTRKSKPNPKAAPEETDERPVPASSGPTIVGIAGSAGALGALQTFFGALPADPGMAFVVVTHLSPEHESHLAALLQMHTQMPVTQVTRQMPVQANHVYVIPPSRNISITDAHVDVSEFTEPHNKRTPIDFFFRTLAKSHRDAVAIILSGGGTDGSVGIKEVKEEGGLLLVQDPQEAEYNSMPNAAIATGLVDLVLPASALAAKLVEFVRQSPRVPYDAETLDEKEWAVVQAILAQVQRRTKHDFSQYKRATVLRRLRRRMLLNNHASLEDYLDYVRVHPAEAFALLNDLLIGVTNFFRDHDAWAALKKDVIAPLFLGKSMSEPIRAWSVGCASGEEAYSLAMVFLEVAADLDESRAIQIFASDIDEESLARAREGLYPAAIETDVSQERLERFFTRQGDHYQVRRELRDMILFTPHNLLRDPPFSRQDLVVCRNLLIYLQREMQQYVLDIFGYSLGSGGYLFLGGSESTAGKEATFQPVDKEQHIYQAQRRRPDQPHMPPMPLLMGTGSLARGLPRASAAQESSEPTLEDQHRRSLEAYGPPSILVGADNTIQHVSDTAGRYLGQQKGPITNSLLKLARPELYEALRGALFQALEKDRATISQPIVLSLEGEPRRLIVAVYPRPAPAQAGRAPEKQALVVFLEDEPLPESQKGKPESYDRAQAMAHSNQVEAELRRLREQLQIVQEEYDSSAEEMKAANEELQSINEEYHLTTEELETSKEELEAVNEELQTVNNELKGKLDETSRAHRDLESVMGAMEIATLFLDRELRIQRFTPALQQFFNVYRSDIGRPIDHLRQKLGIYEQLTTDAQRVLDSLTVVDREIQAGNGKWYLIRVRPYRTVEDKIEGVVITFVDVSQLKQAERAVEELNQTLEERVNRRTQELEEANRRLDQTGSMFSTLFHVNPIPTSLTRLQDGKILDVNEAYAEFFGVSPEEIVGKTTQEVNLPLQGQQRAQVMAQLQMQGSIHDLPLNVQTRNGEQRTVVASLQHLLVDGTEAVLGTFFDLTERVQAEQQIRALAANLTAAEQKERHRIAQMLHDDLQQRLFAVKMQLSFLQQNYQQGNLDAAREDTENLENWLSDAIETTRRMSVDMSPVVLQGSSLTDSLGWLAQEMQERYGLTVLVKAGEELPSLDGHLRILLFESVREVLFNVVKHSDILQAEVTLDRKNGNLRIDVIDHGKGFDADQVLRDPKAAHGLLDFRNRLNLLGGSMRIQSKPGAGTQVQIEVPA